MNIINVLMIINYFLSLNFDSIPHEPMLIHLFYSCNIFKYIKILLYNIISINMKYR